MDSQGGNQVHRHLLQRGCLVRQPQYQIIALRFLMIKYLLNKHSLKQKYTNKSYFSKYYKLYTRYDLRDLSLPNSLILKDFFQEIDLNKDRQFTVENYNGTNYNTIILNIYCILNVPDT